MGMDADADISFGVAFDEGQDFPWTENGDIEDWWRKINGFVPLYEYDWVRDPTPATYNHIAVFKDGRALTDEELKAHYQHKKDWDEAHPMPVMERSFGSDARSCTLLVVPSSHIHGSWDSPTKFDPSKLLVSLKDLEAFRQFMKTYMPDAPTDNYGWMLTAYFG